MFSIWKLLAHDNAIRRHPFPISSTFTRSFHQKNYLHNKMKMSHRILFLIHPRDIYSSTFFNALKYFFRHPSYGAEEEDTLLRDEKGEKYTFCPNINVCDQWWGFCPKTSFTVKLFAIEISNSNFLISPKALSAHQRETFFWKLVGGMCNPLGFNLHFLIFSTSYKCEIRFINITKMPHGKQR